jgi:hypothetical protein
VGDISLKVVLTMESEFVPAIDCSELTNGGFVKFWGAVESSLLRLGRFITALMLTVEDVGVCPRN